MAGNASVGHPRGESSRIQISCRPAADSIFRHAAGNRHERYTDTLAVAQRVMDGLVDLEAPARHIGAVVGYAQAVARHAAKYRASNRAIGVSSTSFRLAFRSSDALCSLHR